MAVEIIMPKAGMAMEEGTIVKWLKEEAKKRGKPYQSIINDLILRAVA